MATGRRRSSPIPRSRRTSARARSTAGSAGACASRAICAGWRRRRGWRDRGGARSTGSAWEAGSAPPNSSPPTREAGCCSAAASPIPFFLLVDFRREAAGDGGDEEAAASLLDHLEQIGLAGRTVVLLVQTGGPRERPLRVVVRPPLAWPGMEGSATAARAVEASELGATLRQIARGDGQTPVPFPGVVDRRAG